MKTLLHLLGYPYLDQAFVLGYLYLDQAFVLVFGDWGVWSNHSFVTTRSEVQKMRC